MTTAASRGREGGSMRTTDGGSRVGGDRWWDPDRRTHLEDQPRFCPGCGRSVETAGTSLDVEYWEGERRIHRLLCGSCDWTADIVRIHRVVSHEPD